MSNLFKDLISKSAKKRKTESKPQRQLYLFTLLCNECEVFEFYPVDAAKLTNDEIIDTKICIAHPMEITLAHIRLAHVLGHRCVRRTEFEEAISEAFDEEEIRTEPVSVESPVATGYDLITPIPVVLAAEWYEDE